MATLWLSSSVVQLFVAVEMFARRFPLGVRSRRDELRRALVALGISVGVGVIGTTTGVGATNPMLIYGFLLAGMVVWGMSASGLGLWPALFCAVSGYAVQNLSSGIYRLLVLVLGSIAPEVLDFAVAMTTAAVTYVVCQRLFVHRIDGRDFRRQGSGGVQLLAFVATELAVIGFDTAIMTLEGDGVPFSTQLTMRLVQLMVCVFVLFSQYEILYASQMRSERDALDGLLVERARQYEISRENIEAINVKCHDIRHQIRSLGSKASGEVDREALHDLAREVDVFDSVVRTGNDALDTILTEKSLLCEREEVTLTCVVDGRSLGFVRPADIYALFSNILDNAIDATMGMDDRGKRSITLVVKRRGGMVTIHEENYFEGPDPKLRNGLPETTKADLSVHGFGMRSIELISERYDGALSIRAREGIFRLDVSLPVPEGE